ncbi:MAG TPA: tripartite tricarboxylate transporter TctB family protein [Pseudolabrys sp.]|nr:tripartite tricarboxylate transporter TctB family protein [Pseudolabrys sp.]
MISRRVLELTTAGLTGAFGLAVVVSSIDNGIGWSTGGVDSGTFPFLTGLIILSGSLFNLARGAFAGREVMISRLDLRRILGLFIPAAVFIGVIPFLGMYIASGAYMFGVTGLPLRRQTLPRSTILAVVTPLALYFVFERLFQVSLPHGAIADILGF